MPAGVDTRVCQKLKCSQLSSFEAFKDIWWKSCNYKVEIEAFPGRRLRVDNDIIPNECLYKNILIATSMKEVKKIRCICED